MSDDLKWCHGINDNGINDIFLNSTVLNCVYMPVETPRMASLRDNRNKHNENAIKNSKNYQ